MRIPPAGRRAANPRGRLCHRLWRLRRVSLQVSDRSRFGLSAEAAGRRAGGETCDTPRPVYQTDRMGRMPGGREDEWLWGWDETPGIVSVWAEADGRALVWRRVAGELVREEERFRPWVLVDRAVRADGVRCEERAGPGSLRYLVSAEDGRTLARAGRWRELGKGSALVLPPEEQYLVTTGRTYFRGLKFDELRRMQFDLETTGLDPEHDRIFLIAMRDPWGVAETLEDGDEAELIRRLVERVRAADPDVIENHNLHGFDLPFLDRRARKLGVPLALGRTGPPGLRQRAARRGTDSGNDDGRRVRFVAPGRELIDPLDAVLRYDFATRELPNHGLKAVARHLGIASPNREHIRGDQVYAVYRRDAERVRRYARADVEEAAG